VARSRASGESFGILLPPEITDAGRHGVAAASHGRACRRQAVAAAAGFAIRCALPATSGQAAARLETCIPPLQRRRGSVGLEEVRVLRGLGVPGRGRAAFRIMAFRRRNPAAAIRQAAGTQGAGLHGGIPKVTGMRRQ
jgi:hypothetical protein